MFQIQQLSDQPNIWSL